WAVPRVARWRPAPGDTEGAAGKAGGAGVFQHHLLERSGGLRPDDDSLGPGGDSRVHHAGARDSLVRLAARRAPDERQATRPDARHGGLGAAARRKDRQPGESAARLAAHAGRGSQLGAGRDPAEALPDVDARWALLRLDPARWL